VGGPGVAAARTGASFRRTTPRRSATTPLMSDQDIREVSRLQAALPALLPAPLRVREAGLRGGAARRLALAMEGHLRPPHRGPDDGVPGPLLNRLRGADGRERRAPLPHRRGTTPSTRWTTRARSPSRTSCPRGCAAQVRSRLVRQPGGREAHQERGRTGQQDRGEDVARLFGVPFDLRPAEARLRRLVAETAAR
jgi:hypothetical protein